MPELPPLVAVRQPPPHGPPGEENYGAQRKRFRAVGGSTLEWRLRDGGYAGCSTNGFGPHLASIRASS
jgi:hypothetical protein